ncbi:MAG: hypothetical protein WEA80_04505 [Gemmatimonadaceae bacterium]
MDNFRQVLGDVEFWKIMAPVLTVVIGWLLNEKARRRADRERRFLQQFERKERSYRKLLELSKGFMVGQAEATSLKQTFLDELQLCWLYASDDVIQAAYGFLDSVRIGSGTPEAEKEHAFASFIATLRKDALSSDLVAKTRLRAADYRLLKAT